MLPSPPVMTVPSNFHTSFGALDICRFDICVGTLYSAYLYFTSAHKQSGLDQNLLITHRLAHLFNIFCNILHTLARYYYLHGLLVFNSIRFL